MLLNELANALRINNPSQIALIKKREELAQRILGIQYDGLYDFFCDVLEYDAEFKILRARRCQVLFELFASIILCNILCNGFELQGKLCKRNCVNKSKQKPPQNRGGWLAI